MMAIIIGAIHGLIVYTAGIWSKSKFLLIITAVLVSFFAFKTGNSMYVGYDVVAIIIGFYVAWIEISRLPSTERKEKKIREPSPASGEQNNTKAFVIILIIFSVIFIFIKNKSTTSHQTSVNKSVESISTKERAAHSEPKLAPSLNSTIKLKENLVREKNEIKVEVTNNNSSGNCYNLKTDREILNCLDSQ